MNTWAAPGVRCVCINDEWAVYRQGAYSLPVRTPMMNEVLTIREVIASGDKIGLTFWEIDIVQTDGPLSKSCAWGAQYFRPLEEKKTDISVFTDMLKGATKEKVRAE